MRLIPLRLGTAATAVAALLGLAATSRAADPPASNQGTRYLYLIRHGMYDRVDSLDDRTANGLNALGHEQARLLGARLASLPVKPRLLVSSDYARARETADDLAAILGRAAERDTLIRECGPPSVRDSSATDSERAEQAECERTLEAAWAKYIRPSPDADAHDLLVCHGNVIRWFVARAVGADTRRWITMTIGNASLTVLAVRPDGSTRLVMFSDVGHLPVEKQTWLGRGAGWGSPAR
ncbi:MAG TPA: histidine phosphatase family protein [Candidatus Eisenbacteria bacterium]|nr:histidine phosphatase family protein [Candidatus Eisenbacteria bacterium]